MKWNDDRGFGFIQPDDPSSNQKQGEIFVHASAFPRDGTRPHVGEPVSFEIETLPDGKRRAVRIRRSGTTTMDLKLEPIRKPQPAPRAHPIHQPPTTRPGRNKGTSPMGKLVPTISMLLGIGVLALIGFRAYSQFDPGSPRPASLAPQVSGVDPVRAVPAQTFTCDGRRYCSQMHSYEEAKFFLDHCPNTQMDGDGDGIPCERQFGR